MKKIFIDFNPFFLKILNLNNRLEFLFFNFNKILFSNSLSFEDIFILKFLNIKKKKIKIFFLKTGKSFNNFINFLNKINEKYKRNNIFVYFPNFLLIDKYIKKYNLNSFYNNSVLRKICCYIRKIEPYNKLTNGFDVIFTGQRNNRKNKNLITEFDFSRNIIKYSLLYNWDYKDIFYFLEKFNILVNFIYNYGFPSLGCEPCTKSVKKEKKIREGRWWWESSHAKKECGLHV